MLGAWRAPFVRPAAGSISTPNAKGGLGDKCSIMDACILGSPINCFFLSFLLWHRDVNQVEFRRAARVTQVQHNFRLSAKINASHSHTCTHTHTHITRALSVNCPSGVAAAATCRTRHINPQGKFICKCEKKRRFHCTRQK